MIPSESDDDLDQKESKGQLTVYEEVQKSSAPQFMTIRLPMLLSNGLDYDIKGKQFGCDSVIWIEKNVPYTTMPLNATYRELFDFDQELDFYVGNYVAN